MTTVIQHITHAAAHRQAGGAVAGVRGPGTAGGAGGRREAEGGSGREGGRREAGGGSGREAGNSKGRKRRTGGRSPEH